MRPFLPVAALLAAVAPMPEPASADDPPAKAVACVAEAVYFEARGTGPRSRAAVAHVVLNRAESADFPDTPCGVVGEGCQFSYQCDGKPERLTVADDRAAAYETAVAALTGEVRDPTRGALFFHAARISPGWFSTRDRVAEIGGHVFYR